MAASQNDLFKKTGASTVTTLSAPGKSLSATSITVGSTTNYPTDSGIVIAIRIVDSSGDLVPGTYTEWSATVTSGTTLSINAVPVYGSDRVYPAGSTTQVYLPLSSYAHNKLIDGNLVSHNQDGTLKSKIVKTANIDDLAIDTPQIKDSAVTTAKIGDGEVTYAKLLATIFGSQVQTYTPTGSGGTGFYINMGGIKMAWGNTNAITTASGSTTWTISMPSSFFTNSQSANTTAFNMSGTAQQYANLTTATTTTLSGYITSNGAGSSQVKWFVLGN